MNTFLKNSFIRYFDVRVSKWVKVKMCHFRFLMTNWDGTQKVGLGNIPQKKEKGWGDKRTEKW